MMDSIFLSFLSLFVAMDAIGILPIFVSLTQGLSVKAKQHVVWVSLCTAFSVAVGFIIFGKMIFSFLGITIGDFMIAGGVILFCLGVYELIGPGKQRRVSAQTVGAVPIGTPLIVGPAVLTTSLMSLDQYGFPATLTAVVANIAIVGLVFVFSHHLFRFLGESGSRALSKVMSLFLSAFAVMMIRRGLEKVLGLYVQFPAAH